MTDRLDSLLDWLDDGWWIVIGVVYGLVYAYVFGGPLR